GERQDHVRISAKWDYLGTEDQTEHRQRVLADIADDVELEAIPGKTILIGADAARFVAEALPALQKHDYVRIIENKARPPYTRLTGDPHITSNDTPTQTKE